MDEEQKPQNTLEDQSEADVSENSVGQEESAEKADDKPSRFSRFKNWYKTNKKKSVPLTIVILIILLFAVPWTRYPLAGVAVKKDVRLKVMDATAATPVSGAMVRLGDKKAITDNNGVVTLHRISVGHHTFTVTKKYYRDQQAKVLVPIFKQKDTPSVAFTATGRQVKIVVTDLVNHQKLEGADIKISGTSAKTDRTGSATVVVPADTTSEKATISMKGYNDQNVIVTVDTKSIKENDFTLTPAGKVYFLSKLSGKIDVVKTNLDGTQRQTVIAGTGREDDRGTVLLASRDWKYLALLSHREGLAASLYLINTADDSISTIDSGASVTFNPIGWSDHNFVYTLTRENIPAWQAGGQALKSYSASTKQLATLDQTRGEGTSQYDYAQENYGGVYQLGKKVVYEKYWNAYYNAQDKLASKQAGIYSISADGTNPQTLKNFAYETGKSTFIASVPYKANQIYYQVTEKDAPSFYAYANGKVSARSDIATEFNEYYQQGAITYLQSPSGNETFWSESRDGKNTLFVGDASGAGGKQIATLSDYQIYGWYSDNYLLVSKNGSELYIIPKSGIKKDSDAIKITDYHKPVKSFPGYGGGYGGI